MPGTYNEDVQMWGKNRKLIGFDRDSCIIYSGTGLYDSPALEANIGLVKNLTIISGNDNGLSEDSQVAKSYGIHIEYANNTEYSVTFENCHVISYLNSGFGIGCRWNQTINILNCVIETKATKFWSGSHATYFAPGGVLVHNDANAGHSADSHGLLNIENCEIIGAVKAFDVHSLDNGNTMSIRFIRNLLYQGENKDTENVVNYYVGPGKGIEPYFCGTDIKLDSLSYGNNSNEVDYDKYWN